MRLQPEQGVEGLRRPVILSDRARLDLLPKAQLQGRMPPLPARREWRWHLMGACDAICVSCEAGVGPAYQPDKTTHCMDCGHWKCDSSPTMNTPPTNEGGANQ